MNETRAARYQRLRRRAGVAELLSGGFALGAVAATPAAGWLAAWVEAAGRGWPGLAPAIYVAALVGLWQVAVLPARLFRGLRVDNRYGPGGTAARDVLAAEAQAALAALVVALVFAGVVRAAVWIAPGAWWVVAGALLAVALAAALRGLPMLLARWGGTRPLARPDLSTHLDDLARRAGVPVTAIEAFRDAPAGPTAFVAGVGRTRRIFIPDEMARDWSDNEVAVVVAHELAHHAHHDLWRAAAASALVLTVALGAADWAIGGLGPAIGVGPPGDLGTWPLLALVAGAAWVASAPIRHAQSRAHERRADAFALALTGGREAFTTAIRRLSAKHLVEEDPSGLTRWLLQRHPSVAERLALANRGRTR